MGRVKLCSPWVSFVHAMKAFFQRDKEVHIDYNEIMKTVTVRVDNQGKADALEQLLPHEVEFSGGDVKLTINVVPSNVGMGNVDLFKAAFAGNEAVVDFKTIGNMYANPITYMIFKKEVVQYWNDNLGDPHNLVSTLYQDLAGQILKDHGEVLFCTDSEEA